MIPIGQSDNDGTFGPLVLLVFTALVIGGIFWRSKRKKTLRDRWAARQGVLLLEFEERSLMRGPFWWRTGRGQVVYRILAQSPDGQTASGWLKLGGWPFGLFIDAAEVRWDDQKPQAPGFPVIFPGEQNPEPPDYSRRN
ncbi:MAG TPA: hypothetical protein VFE47_11135 [Tepidisphaeraceae bacterium]|jgi:hypothetical protein|nr:hypothetical protein [Tepidisphaeraceae bacterium]